MPGPTCVIYNPAAGRGRAKRLIEAAVARLAPDVELRPTKAPGHAVELAEEAAGGFARVVAAGGDGTVHEVANGLLRSGRLETVLSVLPVGSSNDYASALGLTRWSAGRPPGPPLETARVDVGVVRGGGRERFFVNCLGVGFNGMVAVESRRICRLRGAALYTTAFVRAGLRHFRQPPLTVRFDDAETAGPTLAVSVNLGQREGGFPIAPAAELDDGLFDTFHVTGVRRWHLARYLPALLAGTLPADHPNLRVGRCRCAAVRGGEPLCVHADGELFAVPADGVAAIEVELLPKRLAVEACPAYRPAK